MLLIVASQFDPHADAVMLALRELGFVDVFRLDFEEAQSGLDVEIHPEIDSTILIDRHSDRSLRIADVRTIWWRRASSQFDRGLLDAPSPERLDQVETYWALRWAVEAQPRDKFPFGHPHQLEIASNKLLQLRIASQVGLSTPRTIFTNSFHALNTFGRETKSVVLKPLRTSIVVNGDGSRTNIIAKPIDTDVLRDKVADAPGAVAVFCQDQIMKRADIRANISLTGADAFMISNDGMAQDEVDWRPRTFDFDHAEISVPEPILVRCRQFLAAIDLRWGAFDFGVDTDGKWVFFECNPNGQWLWLEFKTGLPLSRQFARDLIEHHRSG